MTYKLMKSLEEAFKSESNSERTFPENWIPYKGPFPRREPFSLDRSHLEILLKESEELAHEARLLKLRSCNGCPFQD